MNGWNMNNDRKKPEPIFAIDSINANFLTLIDTHQES